MSAFFYLCKSTNSKMFKKHVLSFLVFQKKLILLINNQKIIVFIDLNPKKQLHKCKT